MGREVGSITLQGIVEFCNKSKEHQVIHVWMLCHALSPPVQLYACVQCKARRKVGLLFTVVFENAVCVL